MRTGTFAEILREKLENSQGKGPHSTQTDPLAQAKLSTIESLELLKMKTRLFESNPQSYLSTHPKMNKTPYYRFQTHREYLADTKERSRSDQAQADNRFEPAAVKFRPKGVPHKLNDKQSLSMSYFIEEKMFLFEDFTPEELKKAYRKLALVKHPDRNTGSVQAFLALKTHYEILSLVFSKN